MNSARETTAKGSKHLRESIFSLNFALKDAARRHTIDLNTYKDDISAELEKSEKLETKLKHTKEKGERDKQTLTEALEREMMRKSELEMRLVESSGKRMKAELRSERSKGTLEALHREKSIQTALKQRTITALSLLKEITGYVQAFTDREDFTVSGS